MIPAEPDLRRRIRLDMGHIRNMFFSQTGSELAGKSRLGWGKIRRFCLGHFQPGYIKQQDGLRQGQCLRCGKCCKLLYTCPYLEEFGDGSSSCRIHQDRPINCRIFPLDQRDIQDRNLLVPPGQYRPCGFSFTEPKA